MSSAGTTRRRFAFMGRQIPIPSSIVVGGEALNTVLEGVVYLIGPLLILFALAIISLLCYSFITIFYPMLRLYYATSPLRYLYLFTHVAVVLFVVGNVLFNYYMCVMTCNSGPLYDQVVRELADVTHFGYPETPEQVQQYREEYEDKMVLRMRRRKARYAEAQQKNALAVQQQEASPLSVGSNNNNGVSQRKPSNNNAAVITSAIQQVQQQHSSRSSSTAATPSAPLPIIRTWMLLSPYEWGYCGHSHQPKPPRSHYDHVTKTLVLNLDHYCPWMFNAIGYFNYRYFCNCMFFIWCGMCYGLLVSVQPFLLLDSPDFREQWLHERKTGRRISRVAPFVPYRDERTLVTLSFMLCSAVGAAVMLLGGFHLYLLLTAQTTIEFHANWNARRRARQEGRNWKNPYSQGLRRNWQHVYGDAVPWYRAILPSMGEPTFLPVPIPNTNTRRAGKKDEQYATNGDQDNSAIVALV